MEPFGIAIFSDRDETQLVEYFNRYGIPILYYLPFSNKKLGTIDIPKFKNCERPEYKIILLINVIIDGDFSDSDCNMLTYEDKTRSILPEIYFNDTIKTIQRYESQNNDVSKIITPKCEKWINWVNLISHHQFALWHRPNKNEYKRFSSENCTHIITLLGKKESPFFINEFANEFNIKWIHVDLSSANDNFINEDKTQKELINKSSSIMKLLNDSQSPLKILIHCSAGMHRTGLFIYLVLRMMKYTNEQAIAKIILSRRETGFGVGVDRLKNIDKIIKDNESIILN